MGRMPFPPSAKFDGSLAIVDGMEKSSNTRRGVVLLSGGLDRATTLAAARRDGFACHALSVDYGQRHARELDCARAQARLQGVVEHRIVRVDLRAIGGSALTDNWEVPKHRSDAEMRSSIPPTYVPARNTLLLALCLGYAETIGAFDLFIGANAIDYSGYPDCRPEFLDAFARLANLATVAGVEGRGRFHVHAPLLGLSKAEIIRLGASLGVDFAQTLSCYDPQPTGQSCGECDSCLLRARGFAEAGLPDPALRA
jgi:7-cyano-7-deazaguanine synthase